MKRNRLGIITAVTLALSGMLYLAATYTIGSWSSVFEYMFVLATTFFVCIASVFFHACLTEGKEFPKAKFGFIIAALSSLATAVVCWIMTIKVFADALNIIIFCFVALAIASTVWTFSFLAMLWHYQGEIGTDFLSDIRVFVVNALLLGLGFSGIALAFAIKGDGDALVSIALLVTYIPSVALMLLGAFIFFLRDKSVNKNNC